MTDSIEYDLIIAGSGLAGLRAAIEAAQKNSKIRIGVVAKTQVMRCILYQLKVEPLQ